MEGPNKKTPEEIQKAEGMMTKDQENMSVERTETLREGRRHGRDEIMRVDSKLVGKGAETFLRVKGDLIRGLAEHEKKIRRKVDPGVEDLIFEGKLNYDIFSSGVMIPSSTLSESQILSIIHDFPDLKKFHPDYIHFTKHIATALAENSPEVIVYTGDISGEQSNTVHEIARSAGLICRDVTL